MLNLKTYTDFAAAMSEFADAMAICEISFADLKQLDEITPIKNELNTIKKWWNGEVVAKPVETESETITDTKETKTVTSTPKSKKTRGKRGPYNKLTKDRATNISEYVATRHNGDTIEDTIKGCINEFKESNSTIQRLLDKVTFVEISDKYFKVQNGIISAVTEPKNKFGSNQSDISAIKELLKKNQYNVITTISDDMSANDIVKIAMVRLAMYKHGELDTIGGGVKEILIMEAIASNRSGNNDAIIRAVNKRHGVTCTAELVSAVRTGRSHKEIFARF